MLNLALALTVLASNPPVPAPTPAKAPDHQHEAGECHHPPVPTQAGGASTEGWTLHRGEKIGEAKSIPVKTLLVDAARLEGQSVVVEGTVRKACEKKGCWMELAAEDAAGPGVRVTFKDYGFFVPLDSAGSRARVAGAVKVAQLSEERAKHYEGEGAKVPRDAKGVAREVQLVATGVELRR